MRKRQVIGAAAWLLMGLSAAGFIGCSQTSVDGRYSGTAGVGVGKIFSADQAAPAQPPVPAWSRINQGIARDGSPIINDLILKGDAAYVRGDIPGALNHYRAATKTQLSPVEQEALTFRLAAAELRRGDSQAALNTLSNFFRLRGLAVSDVAADFSVLFGVAYRGEGNLQQSVAWLTRARDTAGQGAMSSADTELRAIFASAAPDTLDYLGSLWAEDTHIRTLIGEERRRRAAGGPAFDVSVAATGFTSGYQDPMPAGMSGTVRVGVLLPLSGRYASLGQSTKNGMELAFEGQQQGSMNFEVLYRDTGEFADQAVEEARRLIFEDRVAVIVGPLLSEHAAAVRELMRGSDVPLVTLSKRTDFETGSGVFRLGTTAEMQVASLIQQSSGILGLRRYALVYPEDAASEELVQALHRAIRDAGGEIVYETSYWRDDPKAAIAVSHELEGLSVDAVVLGGGLSEASNIYAALPTQFRRRVRPLGTALWDDPNALMNSSAILNGAVFVSPFFSRSGRPIVADFMRAFDGRYGTKPDFLAAQGFDAVTMVATALKNEAGTGANFSGAMFSLGRYEGLTGSMYVDSDGEIRRTFPVVALVDGNLFELSTPDAAGAAAAAGGGEILSKLAGRSEGRVQEDSGLPGAQFTPEARFQ